MESILEVRGLRKSFSGVQALADVQLDLRAGEIHAVLGENGAGKSTLMRILAGLERPDGGEIRFSGRVGGFRTPQEALQAGVLMIHQELLPFPDLTVAENIFLGRLPGWRIPGMVDRVRMHAEATRLLARLGTSIRSTDRMGQLSVAGMQTVEIARALAHRAQVLILDEPTSASSHREVEALFAILGDLRRQGVAMLYISHRLEEVFRLADRVTVLRDGHWITTRPRAGLGAEDLIAWMAGREIEARPVARSAAFGPVVLAVEDLGCGSAFGGVSFELHQGEILGLAGLMGAGRTSVLHALYGLQPADRGKIRWSGTEVRIGNPRTALAQGIGFVGEDRKGTGLVMPMSVLQNLTLASLWRWCRAGFVSSRAEAAAAKEQAGNLGIRASGVDQPVHQLSGGNQQKVVLGKALLANPRVLLLDEPTRGIDVAAKVEVHALVRRLAEEGRAVLMASSELPELLALCHRLLVMREGRLVAEVDPQRTTPEEILSYEIGGGTVESVHASPVFGPT